jgi:hypothetical protein
LKSKPIRKNRFKKKKAVRRTLLKARAVYTAKALLGVLALVAASGAFIFTHDYFTQIPAVSGPPD